MARVFFHSLRVKYSDAGDTLIQRELLALLRQYGRILATDSGVPASHVGFLHLSKKEIVSSSYVGFIVAIFGALLARIFDRREEVYLAMAPGDNWGDARLGLYLWAAIYPLLKFMGLRAFRVGVSFGKMTTARAKLEAWQSRFMVFNGFRDAFSLSMAKHYGLHNVGYCPDFALRLPFVASSPPTIAGGPLCVAVSFRNDLFDERQTEDLLAAIDQLLAAMAKKRKLKLELIVQVSRDRQFMNLLKERLGKLYACTSHDTLDLDELAAIYDKCTIVLSNRLHALLLGAPLGCLPIPLLVQKKNLKIEYLFDDNGLHDMLVFVGGMFDMDDILGRAPMRMEAVRAMYVKGSQCIAETFAARVIQAGGD